MLNKLIIVCGYDNEKMLEFVKSKVDHYDLFPENSKHPDFARLYILDLLDPLFLDKKTTLAILTHSEFITAYIRYLIVSDVIDCSKVEFWFIDEDKETKITCNTNGNFSDWLPEMSSSLLIEEEIVKLSIEKRVK